MEWNWFFSATAQSSAAIIGLISAFIVTKIVSSQSEFKRRNAQLTKHLNDTQRLEDAINHRPIKWYNKKLREREASKVIELLQSDQQPQSPANYFDRLQFSVYDDRSKCIEAIKPTVDAYRNAVSKGHGQQWLNSQSMDHMTSSLYMPYEELREERERIDQLWTEAKHQARQNSTLHDDIKDNPESSTLITTTIIALIVLFFAGVIYPLHFLPVSGAINLELSFSVFFAHVVSLKGVILTILAVIFVGIMGRLLFINKNLKYDATKLHTLKDKSYIEQYSPYFRNRVENSLMPNITH